MSIESRAGSVASGASAAAALGYPVPIRRRTRLRKVLETFEGYIRIDLVEERMFPAASLLRYLAVVFPVLLYYFQSAFLDMGGQLFSVMLIGTAVTAGLQEALTGLTNRLQYAQERGTLETYLVEPVPWALIPLAMNIWRSVTGGILACIMVGVGWALGAPIEARSIPLALLVLFLGIVACNAVGTLAASFLVLFKRGEPVIALYGLAAGVLGGALFPVSVLPDWIRWVSYLVPHSYVISAERQLLMADPPAGEQSPAVSIAILALFCLVVFTGGLFVFDRSLKLARRLGILSV
ncbi:ABC transporter permease [Micromonospora sp. NPDC047548]|uniref:ABC transporter permease n=1 Tax=Micromonospora sp. NPDC047548 TaxID=3155624 RepID=UPI003408AB3F